VAFLVFRFVQQILNLKTCTHVRKIGSHSFEILVLISIPRHNESRNCQFRSVKYEIGVLIM
jgi:hypothetical protein